MKDWFKARNIWGAAITALPDEDAGKLVKALWTYTMTGEETDVDGTCKGIFAMMMMAIKQDEERDKDISEKRSIAGKSKAQDVYACSEEQVATNDSNCNQMISIVDNKNKNKNKNKSKNKEQESDIYFEQFWNAYPRHVNKQTAKRAFDKLKVDEEMLGKLLEAIERQKQSTQWQENEGQFIPHPATWLNGHRWEDEVRNYKQTGKIKTVIAQQYTQNSYDGEQEDAERRWIQAMMEADGN